jgi:23S rRNA (guanosine2251-2'-O)-methyltransferase
MRLAAILYDIRSVHNVGSIFRTADAAGVEKIYCCGITPTPHDPFGRIRADFAKVSLGAEKSVAWVASKSAERTIAKLKKDGWKIFAVEQSKNSIPYHKILRRDIRGAKIALVMGNEVSGIPSRVIKKCDAVLEIPMRGAKESLNVAVAFGIVAFALLK